jgi:hypothetical protein
MPSDPLELILGVNLRMALLLEKTRQALRGESIFGPEEVRDLLEPITQMNPIVSQVQELRRENAEMANQIGIYNAYLGSLQAAVEQIHMMLLGKRAVMESSQRQLYAVSQWTNALERTR